MNSKLGLVKIFYHHHYNLRARAINAKNKSRNLLFEFTTRFFNLHFFFHISFEFVCHWNWHEFLVLFISHCSIRICPRNSTAGEIDGALSTKLRLTEAKLIVTAHVYFVPINEIDSVLVVETIECERDTHKITLTTLYIHENNTNNWLIYIGFRNTLIYVVIISLS